MAGLEIKFWDLNSGEYVKEGWYVVSDSGEVMQISLQGIVSHVESEIEAHIYIEGMRVA